MRLVTTISFALATMGMQPATATAQDIRVADQARVTDSVHVFLTRYIAAYESRNLQAVMALYPTGGPVSSAMDGRVTTSRDSLSTNLGQFLQRLKDVSFSTEPPMVTVLDPRTAAITLVFHGTGTWNDGSAFSTNGLWTAVLGERDGHFAIIQ